MRSGGRCSRLASPAGLGGLTAVYIMSAVACCLLASRANANFVDLHVYRAGATAVLHGRWLYGVRYQHLPFTYPPFAAAVFTALPLVPFKVAAGLMLLVSAVGIPVMFYLVLRLRPVAGWLTRTQAAALALAAGTLALWLEPARSTLGFGQVNIVLAVLVLADLALPEDCRFKGLAIGVAAGIKLTPAIFALYLLATRRYRAAAVATAALGLTLALGYAVAPASSAYFWDMNFLRPDRISPLSNDWNQSLLGAIARDLGHQPGRAWLLAELAVLVLGIGLAAAAGRRGNEAAGFGLSAVTGLLVSPISWTHHWAIALPALLVAGLVAWRRRRESPRRAAAWLAGIVVLLLIGVIGLARRAPRMPAGRQLHLSPFWLVVSQVYVLAGLTVLAIAAWPYLSRWATGRRAADHWRQMAAPAGQPGGSGLPAPVPSPHPAEPAPAGRSQ